MPKRIRRVAWLIPTIALLIAASDAIGPGANRLGAIPTAVRSELTEALRRFDALPNDQRRAIRDLDEAIARMEPAEGGRYLELLRRYGSWTRSLDAETQRSLAEATPDQKLALIRERLRSADQPEPTGATAPDRWVASDVFNPIPLFEASYLLRVWAGLDDQTRLRLEAIREPDARVEAILDQGRSQGIEWAPGVLEVFEPTIANLRGRFPSLHRLRGGNAESIDPKRFVFEGPGRLEGPGRGMPRPPQGRVEASPSRLRLAILRIAERRFLRDLRSPTTGAGTEELLAFEGGLPEWYRATLDPLPPEAARDRVLGLMDLAGRDPELAPNRSEGGPPPAEAPRTPSTRAPGGQSF